MMCNIYIYLCFRNRFLGYVSGPMVFLGLSIALRIIEGIGEAAFIAASFAIIAAEFPETLASTFVSLIIEIFLERLNI